ncbi:chemotaxis protein CheA [Donghicola mangrovi]|nr:chemotaxis protein CheA [Donghicola mangrovi]
MSMDTLKATFFAECEELVEAMAEGLNQIASDDWDTETVNAIFRAVHSIKGAAGAFGLEKLVAFAHRFETVLDRIRSNELNIDTDVLRVITRSSDVLAELVELAQSDAEATPSAYDALLQDLSKFTGAAEVPVAEEAFFAPLAFAPMPLLLDENKTICVRIFPDAAFYRNGHEPERVIGALGEEISVLCDFDAVPLLDGFDLDHGYLNWTVEVSDTPREQIEAALTYVQGLGQIGIHEDPPVLPDLPLASQIVEQEVVQSAPEPRPASSSPRQASAQTLRVDPERVDRLINTVGELIINQAVIAQKIEASGRGPDGDVSAALDDYRYLAREIQEAVMSIRAQPVKSLFQRMARVVREAGEATGKQVQFDTVGENTEIDKTLIERLADPLTHMLRNAVDHGLESPDRRAKTDKPQIGTVRLMAAHRSGHVVIEVADDGAGLNRTKILEKARDKGLVPAEAKLSDSEVDNLLFMPGFSTADQVTNLSGRGVGMDVVKTAITAIGGRISISSEPEKGSIFSISLPLTLAVLDGIVVSVADETMVVPIASIIETIRPAPGDVIQVAPDQWVLKVRGAYVSVIVLGPLLGLSKAFTIPQQGPFILVEAEDASVFAFAVNEIWDQRQIVIKSLEGNYGAVPGVSAATILGDGKIALIVDPDALISLAGRPKFETDLIAANG